MPRPKLGGIFRTLPIFSVTPSILSESRESSSQALTYLDKSSRSNSQRGRRIMEAYEFIKMYYSIRPSSIRPCTQEPPLMLSFMQPIQSQVNNTIGFKVSTVRHSDSRRIRLSLPTSPGLPYSPSIVASSTSLPLSHPDHSPHKFSYAAGTLPTRRVWGWNEMMRVASFLILS